MIAIIFEFSKSLQMQAQFHLSVLNSRITDHRPANVQKQFPIPAWGAFCILEQRIISQTGKSNEDWLLGGRSIDKSVRVFGIQIRSTLVVQSSAHTAMGYRFGAVVTAVGQASDSLQTETSLVNSVLLFAMQAFNTNRLAHSKSSLCALRHT